MKKLFSIVLCLCVVATLFAGGVFVSANEVTVELDGKAIEFDVNPEVIDGRTMVPLRKIFEEIGALVKWDNETQTVTARKNSKTVSLTIGSEALTLDKGKTDDAGNPITETVVLDVPAQLVSGRTLVPARAISESFGLNVDWNENAQKVIITSDDEKDDTWKENTGEIHLSDLTFTGNGIEINGSQIKITAGGDFTLSGTLQDGNITIETKERVKLRLSGAEITSSENPCIFAKEADKVFITVTEGTENVLIAKNSEDGAIYSKENLEIKGDGQLTIQSDAGHGIKSSDNLTIESGNLFINAANDGIHVNDTFKMLDGTIQITAIGDGIDSESIVNISGGNINIETNGTPITPVQTQTETPRRGMWEEAADVEFEKSTKGINAEWMMVISGGEINIHAASHTIHCQDEIQIDGGKFNLSSKYDKGISAHGNLTIGGATTSIDITKSTEGIESKNVMTINDGLIKVYSTDDAINATGGKSGMMVPGGNFGGNFDGNRVPPEGTGKTPGNRREPTADGTQQPQRPNRTENGQGGGMRPGMQMPENGEFTPPENFDPNNFRPSFEMPENGGGVPPAGTRPQQGNQPGGPMGGRNQKVCLIINGGTLELCGNDDCIDANGNMTINGGTIMAANPTGAFSGNFGVLDADGQITISENANLILAASSGNAERFGLKQVAVTVYCENNHTAEDKITVSDNQGNEIYTYVPNGNFKAVFIASSELKIGEKYTITIGNETFEAEITGQSITIGTQTQGGTGFGRGPGMQ